MTKAEQRRIAWEKGNERRFRQAALRKEINALDPTDSRVRVAALFRDPGDFGYVRARYLIESTNRFGPARIGRLIRKAGLQAGRLERRLSELPQRERDTIADYLEDLERPAVFRTPDFTTEDLALLSRICNTVADRTSGPSRNRLLSIAKKCELSA